MGISKSFPGMSIKVCVSVSLIVCFCLSFSYSYENTNAGHTFIITYLVLFKKYFLLQVCNGWMGLSKVLGRHYVDKCLCGSQVPYLSWALVLSGYENSAMGTVLVTRKKGSIWSSWFPVSTFRAISHHRTITGKARKLYFFLKKVLQSVGQKWEGNISSICPSKNN